MTLRRIGRALLTVLTLLLALVWAFPVYWMVNSSMLSNVTLQSTTPTFLPFGGSFDNFAAVFSDPGFLQALGVSLAVTLGTVAASLFIAFLGALAISRFRFRGRKSFILALLLIQMLPAEGLFIAQYKMMSGIGMLNSVLGQRAVGDGVRGDHHRQGRRIHRDTRVQHRRRNVPQLRRSRNRPRHRPRPTARRIPVPQSGLVETLPRGRRRSC